MSSANECVSIKNVSFYYGSRRKGSYSSEGSRSLYQKSRYDWHDLQYSYDTKTDIFRLFFIRTEPGMIQSQKELWDGNIFVEMNRDNKIVVMGFKNASTLLSCHLDVDFESIVNEKKPLAIAIRYSWDVDVLSVSFVNDFEVEDSTDIMDNVVVDFDSKGTIGQLEIIAASKILLRKELPAAV